MHVREIKELIQAVSESSLAEFTLEDEEKGLKLTLRKPAALAPAAAAPPEAAVPAQASAPPPGEVPETLDLEEDELDDSRYVTITAPMVGTFYRAPAPDAEPYVNVGDHVTVGQALCIIEAMKLMNEIESEVKGRIVKILVENAEPVEYGQPLFVIEKE